MYCYTLQLELLEEGMVKSSLKGIVVVNSHEGMDGLFEVILGQ